MKMPIAGCLWYAGTQSSAQLCMQPEAYQRPPPSSPVKEVVKDGPCWRDVKHGLGHCWRAYHVFEGKAQQAVRETQPLQRALKHAVMYDTLSGRL